MLNLACLAAAAAIPLLAAAQFGVDNSSSPSAIEGNGSAVLPNGKYEISSEGIRANFIPYGASLSNLFMNDTHGVERDIVLGFDNATYYSESRLHPHLCGIPGRYANRIKNGTFTIDGETYHTNLNDNGGLDTLHGGSYGWDYRNWTVVAHTTDSITFSIDDPDGSDGMGFPGEVIAYVTYTLTPYQWHLRMTALSTTKKTPIMLSSHTYWNLDGFQNPSTPLALNYSLYLPYAGTRTEIDNIEIPTGNILGNQQYSVNDWWSAPKQLGANITSPDLKGNCGYNCTGYVAGNQLLTLRMSIMLITPPTLQLRQLLHPEPRRPRPLQLAPSARRHARLALLRHLRRRLHGPGRLPSLQLQQHERHVRHQGNAGLLQRLFAAPRR